MSVVAIDLDQRCSVVARNPARRAGPMRLRTAIRRMMEHPPPRQEFDIERADGAAPGESEIGATSVLASLTMWAAPLADRPAASPKP